MQPLPQTLSGIDLIVTEAGNNTVHSNPLVSMQFMSGSYGAEDSNATIHANSNSTFPSKGSGASLESPELPINLSSVECDHVSQTQPSPYNHVPQTHHSPYDAELDQLIASAFERFDYDCSGTVSSKARSCPQSRA